MAFPYRRILLATGGAPHSRVAEERAMTLARTLNAELEVVVTVPMGGGVFANFASGVPGGEGAEAEAVSRLRDGRQAVLDRVLSEAAGLGLRARGHLLTGVGAAEGIVRTATQTGADVVVLGRRQRGALGAVLGASISDAVNHSCKVDVIVAR